MTVKSTDKSSVLSNRPLSERESENFSKCFFVIGRRGKHHSAAESNGNRISIGQLVASEAAKKTAKKRRSKESVDLLDEVTI